MAERPTDDIDAAPPFYDGMTLNRRCALNYASKTRHTRKVDEINTNLTEEITPRLDELRGQKTHYLKWKANDGEENRLQKFCVAYSYNQAETTLNSSEEEKKELEAEQQSLQAAKEQAEVKCQCSCVHVCVLAGRGLLVAHVHQASNHGALSASETLCAGRDGRRREYGVVFGKEQST